MFHFHLSKKILIGISLVLSFILTSILGPILTPPYPKLETIVAMLKKIQEYKVNLRFPISNLQSLIINYRSPAESLIINYRSPAAVHKVLFSKVPTIPTTNTKPSIAPQPLSLNTKISTTINPQQPTTIQPTNTPKPTKIPKATPTPKFVLTNPRPGKNIREIAEIVGPLFCVPPAMVYAIYDNEAGYLGPKINANWTYYNTYHGSDPTDIPGSTSVFGVTQMMGDTWHRIKPYVAKILGSTDISLNVTFDSMAATAFHIRNVSLAGTDHVACDDWPVKYILYGACRYNGACPANTMGQTQYYNSYTYNVCASYNEYGTKQKNCH